MELTSIHKIHFIKEKISYQCKEWARDKIRHAKSQNQNCTQSLDFLLLRGVFLQISHYLVAYGDEGYMVPLTWCLSSPGALSHQVPCFTRCLSSPGACLTWYLVSLGALAHLVPCLTWCLVSPGALSLMFTCMDH